MDRAEWYAKVESLPERYPGVDLRNAFQGVLQQYTLRIRPPVIAINLSFPIELVEDIVEILETALQERGDDGGGSGVLASLPKFPPPRMAADAVDLPDNEEGIGA